MLFTRKSSKLIWRGLFALIGMLLLVGPATTVKVPLPTAVAAPILMGRNCVGTSLAQFGASVPLNTMSFTRTSDPELPTRFTWNSDADFLTGTFAQTEVVPGSDRVSLARFGWSANVPAGNTDATVNRIDPDLALDAGGNLYVSWQDIDPDQAGIFVARVAASLPGTTTFGREQRDPVRVNDRQLASAIQARPALARDASDNLYAVWQNRRRGSLELNDLFFARSSDGGQTWSASMPLTTDETPLADTPHALVAGAAGQVYVVWASQRNSLFFIFFSASSDGGATWTSPVPVNDPIPRVAVRLNPDLALDQNGHLYVAWQDNRNGNADIFVARSTDGGQTWSADVRVNDDTGAASQSQPSLVAGAEGRLHIVWHDTRTGIPAIFSASSSNGGQTWSANMQVDAGQVPVYNPRLMIDAEGTLYCAWCAQYGNAQIYAARSTSGGETWETAVRVNDVDGTATPTRPRLAADAVGNMYLAWGDDRNSQIGEGNVSEAIYLARWPGETPQANGVYTSAVYVAQRSVAWRILEWMATQPVGTTIALEVRVGDTAVPDQTWSDWMPLQRSPADISSLAATRYLQWRTRFTSADAMPSPTLDAVTVIWQLDEDKDKDEDELEQTFLPLIIR